MLLILDYQPQAGAPGGHEGRTAYGFVIFCGGLHPGHRCQECRTECPGWILCQPLQGSSSLLCRGFSDGNGDLLKKSTLHVYIPKVPSPVDRPKQKC